MPGTAFALTSNSVVNSLELDENTLVDRSPQQLVNDGYTVLVDFAPSQGAVLPATGISLEEQVRDDSMSSTVFRPNRTEVIQLPASVPVRSDRPTLHALQEWEGWVVDIGDDDFISHLVDLTAGATASAHEWIEEEATIPLSELSDDDRRKMELGSIFRWVIGYRRTPSGTKQRISEIVFRDLPAITTQDLAYGEEWATKIAQTLQD